MKSESPLVSPTIKPKVRKKLIGSFKKKQDVKLDVKGGKNENNKVRKLIEAMEQNMKVDEATSEKFKNLNTMGPSVAKVKDAFELLMSAKGDTHVKTPIRSAKRRKKRLLVTPESKMRKLDNWVEKQ